METRLVEVRTKNRGRDVKDTTDSEIRETGSADEIWILHDSRSSSVSGEEPSR